MPKSKNRYISKKEKIWAVILGEQNFNSIVYSKSWKFEVLKVLFKLSFLKQNHKKCDTSETEKIEQ